MQKPPLQKDSLHRPTAPKILRPQTQESITLANILLLQGPISFNDTYGFIPNNHTFLKGSPREKACIMHFLLMIADCHEAKQQFAFLEPAKGSGVIHFKTCDLSLFRDRAYVIASALSNMAGFEIVPRAEFLGFSAKSMNMMFRLSIYCIREQSKRLLRRLSFVDFNAMNGDTAFDLQDVGGEPSNGTFFDESLSTAVNPLLYRQMNTITAGKPPCSSNPNFAPGPLSQYCSAQISLISEDLDVDTLLAERISDIYGELLNAEKDQSYYESVVRCLTKHNYETKTPESEKISCPRTPASIGDALLLLQNLNRELQEIPSEAYTFLARMNSGNSPSELNIHDESVDIIYPEIQIEKLRELHETNIQPSSANFPLICAGAASLLRNTLSNEALHSVSQSLFLHPCTHAPDHPLSSHDYKKQLSDVQSSIKALQARITALRKDSSSNLHLVSTDTEDMFTEAILQALGGADGANTKISEHRRIEDSESTRDSRAGNRECLRMSLRATTRAQETDKLSSRLHKTFSGERQAIPVSTFVADSAEGRLLNTMYVGDE